MNSSSGNCPVSQNKETDSIAGFSFAPLPTTSRGKKLLTSLRRICQRSEGFWHLESSVMTEEGWVHRSSGCALRDLLNSCLRPSSKCPLAKRYFPRVSRSFRRSKGQMHECRAMFVRCDVQYVSRFVRLFNFICFRRRAFSTRTSHAYNAICSMFVSNVPLTQVLKWYAGIANVQMAR